MDLSGYERRWLTEIENELIADAPDLARALGRWSTGPLRPKRVRATVRAVVAGTSSGVVLSMIVLGVGVALLVLGVVYGWVVCVLAGVVIAQFGPWLVACRVQARKAGVPSRPRALRS